MCEIFFSLLLPFLMEFKYNIKKLLSFNPILNCFVQCTIYTSSVTGVTENFEEFSSMAEQVFGQLQ